VRGEQANHDVHLSFSRFFPHINKQVLDMPLFTHGRLAFKDGIKEAPVLLSEDEKFLYCDLENLVFLERKRGREGLPV